MIVIVFVLIINIIAIITCGISAGMNFSNDNTLTGMCMIALCVVNLMCLVSNLGRI